MASLHQEVSKIDTIVMKIKPSGDGHHARYKLQKMDDTDQCQSYNKIYTGVRNQQKPHKAILLVGETGTGKTTLINTMVNYLLGVKREDKVWFEITDDQSDRSSVHSQTSIITVYGFYLEESPIDLTVIDTPGFGDTRGVDLDEEIAKSLLNLSKSEEGIHEIHAVCLVIKASQNRLSDRQKYIFDAVQSLFGTDIAENIVLLFTHSDGGHPKNALTAVEEAKIKCAVNSKSKPMFFLFNNCQLDPADVDPEEYDDEYAEENKQRLDLSWNLSFRGMERLFKFLDTINPKSLEKTRDVLQKRAQLEANAFNLQSRVKMTELKQNELKQTQDALEQFKDYVKEDKNFQFDVEVVYKKEVDIDTSKASMAMCCTVCEENCHYPGCWWVSKVYWCSVFDRAGYCTVCTKKCYYTKHVKHPKIYIIDTEKTKTTYEEFKKKYKDKENLEEELQELKKEKIKLVNDAFDCVETLQKNSLKADSVFILQHIDFLIQKLKEIKEPEKAKTLENIKKRAGEEKHGAMGYVKKFFKL